MSAPQHIGVRAPTGRLSGVRERVGSPANCRWGADRSAVWRSGADLSAPQQIVVGEPTGRFPRTLPLGARHVGSLDTATTKSGAQSQTECCIAIESRSESCHGTGPKKSVTYSTDYYTHRVKRPYDKLIPGFKITHHRQRYSVHKHWRNFNLTVDTKDFVKLNAVIMS